ncbi:hypothetical protein [Vibrio phage phiKT1028]|nr:hypothetical protein [Vibrio phage phiKT1028]
MFEKTLTSPETQAVIPGAGPQLPNDNEASRIHYIWDIYNPDTVKSGEESRYRVPKEKEVVVDPVAQQWYIVTHVNWEGDLRSTLEPIFVTGGEGDVDPLNSIFGLPAGYQGEAIVGIDYSVRPNRAVIDGQVMAPGAAYGLLYEGNTVGENGKVISVLYGSNGEMISNRIPTELAAHHDLTNKEIMVTQPFSVNRNAEELPDGSRCTLVWFDHTGNMIPKARSLSVQHTSLLRDHQVGKRYIRKVELIAPWFLSSADPKTLHIPVNTVLQNLSFRAVVHYSDGSKSEELPIDGQKVILYGLNEHKPSTPSQRGTLTLVYNLDRDEHIYEAQAGNPNQYRDSYSLLAVEFDGAYSPKLYSYPTWVNGQYLLKHYLTDLDRSFIIDATDHVRINELSPAFRPTTYGVEQTLELNLRLSDVVPTFEPMIMRQSTTFILKTPGTEDGSKFDVRYSYDQRAYNDPTFRAVNQADGRQQIEFGGGFETQEEWLDELYHAVEPAYNTRRERGPMAPTHFEVEASSGKVYSFELSQWDEKIYLDTQEPQARTIFVRWVHETIQGEKLLLATTGISIDVVEGPSTETPEPTSIEFDSSMVTEIGEGEVFEVSGVVYDQNGKPMKDGLTTLLVRGGVFHAVAPRKIEVKIDGSFRFYTWSEKAVGETQTLEFAFETGKAPVYFTTRDIDIVENDFEVVNEFYPYSPTKVSVNKPARAFGYMTDGDGNRLTDYQFYSLVGDDLDSIKVESTDDNGDFLLSRFHGGSESLAIINVKAGGTDDVRTLSWIEGESYGDRITIDQLDWTYVGTEQMALTGRVYDQFGDLVSDVSTTVGFGPQWNPASVTKTGLQGSYVLNHAYMEPGDAYDIVVWTDNDFVFATVTWEEEVVVADRIVMDSTNPDEAPAGTTVRITGKLVDLDGNDFVSDSQTPITVTRLGSGENNLIYAGLDGKFEYEVGPFNDWEVTTFLFELAGKPPVTHTVTWMGEPAKLNTLKFDTGLATETKVGLPITLMGDAIDQHGKLFAPGVPFEFEVEYAGKTGMASSPGDGRWSYSANNDTEGDVLFTFKSDTRVVGTYTIKFAGEIFIRPLPNVDMEYRIPTGESMTVGWYVVDENNDIVVGQRVDIKQTLPIENNLGYGITDKYGKFEYTVPYYPAGFGEIYGYAGVKEAPITLAWRDEEDIGFTISSFSAPQYVYNGVTALVRAIVRNENGEALDTGRLMCYSRDTYTLVDLIPYDANNMPEGNVELNGWNGNLLDGEQAYWVGPLPEGKHDLVFFTESETKLWPMTWRVYDKELSRIELAEDTATKALTPTDAPTVYIRGTGIAGDESVFLPSTPKPVTWEGSDGTSGNTVVNVDGSVGYYITNVAGPGTVVYTIKDGARILATFEIEYINGTLTELPYSQTMRLTGESAIVAWGVRDENDQAVEGLTLLKAINPVENEIYTNGITDEWGIMELVLDSTDAIPGSTKVTVNFDPENPTVALINTTTTLGGDADIVEMTAGTAYVRAEAEPRSQTVSWFEPGTTDPLMANVTDVTFASEPGYGLGEVKLFTGVEGVSGVTQPTANFVIFDKGSFDYVDCGTTSEEGERPPYYDFQGDGSLEADIRGGASWDGTRHLLFATGYDIHEETVEWVGEEKPVAGLAVLPYSNVAQVTQNEGFVAIGAMTEEGEGVPNIPVTMSLGAQGAQTQTVLTDEFGIAEFTLPSNDGQGTDWTGPTDIFVSYAHHTTDWNIAWGASAAMATTQVRWSDHTETVGAGSEGVIAAVMMGVNNTVINAPQLMAFNKTTMNLVPVTPHNNLQNMFYGHIEAQPEGVNAFVFSTPYTHFERTLTWVAEPAKDWDGIDWVIANDSPEVVSTFATNFIDGKLLSWTAETGEQPMRIMGPVTVDYRRSDGSGAGTAYALPDGTVSIPVGSPTELEEIWSFTDNDREVASKTVKFIDGATVDFTGYSHSDAVTGTSAHVSAFVKDAEGNGVPNATIVFALSNFSNVPFAKVKTDQFGIAEAALAWDELLYGGNPVVTFGPSTETKVVTWSDVNDIVQFPANFGLLNFATQAELPNQLTVNGTILTQNGNQGGDYGYVKVFSKETLTTVDLSAGMTTDGSFNSSYGPFLEGGNTVVFAVNGYHQVEEVVWNEKPMELAELRVTPFISSFAKTGSTMTVTGNAFQASGEAFTPDSAVTFDAINVATDEVVKGTINPDGTWTVDVGSAVEGEVTYTFTEENDEWTTFGDFVMTWYANATFRPAAYTTERTHLGSTAYVAYVFQDQNGNPIVGETFAAAVDNQVDEEVANAVAVTNEFGIATFDVPYVQGRNQIEVYGEFGGIGHFDSIDWVSESIHVGTEFTQVVHPEVIGVGDTFRITGSVLDTQGNPTTVSDVGIFDLQSLDWVEAQATTGGNFVVEYTPQGEGPQYIALYTEAYFQMFEYTTDGEFVKIDQVNVLDGSNKYILIDGAAVLPKPEELVIELSPDNPQYVLVEAPVVITTSTDPDSPDTILVE